MQYCTLAEQLYLNRRLAQNMEQSSFGKADGQEDSTELMEICWHGRHHRCRRAVIMVPRLTSGRVWLWSQRAVCTVCHSSGSRAWINEARFHKDRYMANLPTHVHGKIRMDSTMNDAENTSMASWHVLASGRETVRVKRHIFNVLRNGLLRYILDTCPNL